MSSRVSAQRKQFGQKPPPDLSGKSSYFRVAGCNITMMTDNSSKSTALWHETSAKNVVILALIWFGEAFLILMFITRALHGSTYLYLLMIPWALIGVIMAARPNWFVRVRQAMADKAKRDMERLDKWTPPGFP